jgi:hypothetical protein
MAPVGQLIEKGDNIKLKEIFVCGIDSFNEYFMNLITKICSQQKAGNF